VPPFNTTEHPVEIASAILFVAPTTTAFAVSVVNKPAPPVLRNAAPTDGVAGKPVVHRLLGPLSLKLAAHWNVGLACLYPTVANNVPEVALYQGVSVLMSTSSLERVAAAAVVGM
jgi:hypothetical protein